MKTKQVLSAIAVSALAASLLPGAIAADDSVKVVIDGSELVIGADEIKPFIENERTLVPMRAIFESLGVQVEWDEAAKTVTARDIRQDISIKMQIGSDVMEVNGIGKSLDVPARIAGGRAVVPLRAVSDGLNASVSWDAAARTATIVSASAGAVKRSSGFTETEIVSPAESEEFRSKYKLEEMVVLSRHNIRSPLSDKDSVLGRITPHQWFDWSSNASELSLRGGALETIMGQYFRKWAENDGLIPENYRPEGDEVRFYANSKQRTIATAQYFSSGMLPVANVVVEHRAEYDKMDPVFNPQLTFVSDEYTSAALEQIAEMGGGEGFKGIGERLSGAYGLAADVIDMKESEAYKRGEVSDFRTDDVGVVLEKGKEPAMTGSLKTACSVSDALVLQLYEEPDLKKAAFGKELSAEDWKTLSSIKDTYGDVLFTAPLVAQNVAHPLLEEIRSELTNESRRFSFLCGHDSNLGSVLAALGNEDYSLPDTVESKTPIGSKLVMEKWINSAGEEFVSVKLVYQTTEQLRGISLLTLDAPPMSFDMSFKNTNKNEDGLYTLADFMKLLDNAIQAYDKMKAEYGAAEDRSAA